MIKIGLLGLGTVGSGVYKIMENNYENIKNKVGTALEIKKILVNDIDKQRELQVDRSLITSNYREILEDPEINLVVELIGGEEPAHKYIIEALKNKKSVVTANKLVIAKHGNEILSLAREKEVQISYEGSVAGGIPIIRPLKESLAANRIDEIYGILNGTTNYILTRMAGEKLEFNKVLQEAIKQGYAESDPTSDISGLDAAYKISILASLAFETFIDVNRVYVEGIENISLRDIELAEELGYVIKLLAIGKKENDGLDIRVHPSFIPRKHPLALIDDVYNAVYIHGDAVGDVMSTGRGAGQMPTGSAVVADIIQVARDIHNKRLTPNLLESFQNYKLKNIEEVENCFYLRIQVKDKPGVMSRVTKILGDNRVSLASVLQKHRLTPVVPLILITHPVKEKYINQSLEELRQLDDVITINNIIRVEESS